MEGFLVGLIGMFIFLIIAFMGVPISYAMLIVGIWGISYIYSFSAASKIIYNDLISTFSSYTFSVIPMFIFMGMIAYQSGIGADLFNTITKLFGKTRGGLAIAVQGACALFGAVCGSLTATVATIGTIAYPEMKKRNYSDLLSTGCIVCGASLATMIPPSVPLIIYGVATEQPVGRLFLAGIIPGLLHMTLYIGVIVILLKVRPDFAPTVNPKTDLREKVYTVFSKKGGVIEIFIVFFISLGGLFSGWITPTEAGALGAFSILVISSIEKRINWMKLRAALVEAVRLSVTIYLLIAGAKILGRFIALTRIPFMLGEFISYLDLPVFIIMSIILLIYFLLGFIIDALPLILLTIPVFFPVITSLGFDPIWFGILMLVVMSMGVVTPPVGLNVYVMKGIASEVPLETIFKGAFIFLIADFLLAILLILFPSIPTLLPNLLM